MPTTADGATSNESTILPVAKRKWSRRKKIFSSSVAISLIVIAVIFAYISSLGIGGCGCTVPLIYTTKSSDANNWTWTITSIMGGTQILKSDVNVQLKNASGFVFQNVSLTAASGTHGFKYNAATSDDYIYVGEVFSLSRDYLQGCEMTLVTPSYSGQYAVLTV